MSFSYELKKEIISQPIKSICCRRAFLLGVLFAKGDLSGEKEILLSFEKQEFIDFIATLVSEIYGSKPVNYRSSKGGRQIFLSFESTSASKYIARIQNLTNNIDIAAITSAKCSSCIPAFLRGVFFASGRISDPKKQFSLEFSLGERSDAFGNVLCAFDMNPKIVRRQRGDILYFHTNSEIEDFFGHAGVNHVVFDVIEAKINSLAKRETQRYINGVTYNYNRMVDVSDRQMAIIKRLEELDLLSSLPDELESTARIKMEYSDLPLSALAAKMTPAISKSGLSHRLKKIEELGARLLKLDVDN